MSDYDPLDPRKGERDKADVDLRKRIERESEESDLKWLMSSKRGRRILWRLLDRAGVFRISFNTNAMQMAFAEGNRNEGLRTLSKINSLCPELYPVMIREQSHDNRIANSTGHNDQ